MDFHALLYGGVYALGFLMYALSPSLKFSRLLRLNLALAAGNGAIIGGRLGYVCFYEPLYYFREPMEIICIWHGGMSYHGGVLGIIIGLYLYVSLTKMSRTVFYHALDRACLIALLIIPLGRICNFYNGELWGRPTEMLFGVIFEGIDDKPRHPVQLYEAFLEGPVLALILLKIAHKGFIKKTPFLSYYYMIFYSILRFFTEFVREPDVVVGFIGMFTLGQILCLIYIILTLLLMHHDILFLHKKRNNIHKI